MGSEMCIRDRKYTYFSLYNDNLMVLAKSLAAKAPELESFRRPKWAQMKAELFLQVVLVFFFGIAS